MKNVNTLSAAFIATYPPRKCGIGTFTFDLVQSLNHLSEIGAVREDHLQIIAMNNIPEGYAFPPEANFVIREQYKSDYQEAGVYFPPFCRLRQLLPRREEIFHKQTYCQGYCYNEAVDAGMREQEKHSPYQQELCEALFE